MEKIEANIEKLKKIQSYYQDTIASRLEGTVSSSELKRLDRIMKEIENLESLDEKSLKIITKDFGYLDWEFLMSTLTDIGEGDLLINLEKQLYRVSLDYIDPNLDTFYPHDSSMKYQLNRNDKPYTKALKSLINIIYKYQEDIAIAARNKRNDLGLILAEDENKLNPSDLDENRISDANLGRLLDTATSTVGDWVGYFESFHNPKKSIKKLIKLKLFIENSPFYNTIKHVQNVMLMSLDQLIFNDITSNILYSFSKYSHDTFSEQGLSLKFDMNKNYLSKIERESTGEEEHTKCFRLLTIVYLADPNEFNLIDNNNYENIKKEVHEEIFDVMVRKGKIQDKSYRLDFDAIFYTVLTLTKAKMDTPEVRYNLYSPTLLAESMGYDRNLFRQKMLEGREITNTQADEMKDEMSKASADTLAQEFHQLAVESLDNVVERNGEFVKDDYIKYFWDFLYEIQVVELLKITL